jgi:hypothetical protein
MRGKDRMNRKINKEVNDNAAAVVAVVAIWRAIKRRKNRKDRLYVTSECLDRRSSVTSVCRLPNDTPTQQTPREDGGRMFGRLGEGARGVEEQKGRGDEILKRR